MSATARLVVQMTPAEKVFLDQRAHEAGLTTSEFVRRRVSEDDIQENREEIESLLSALKTSAPAILEQLDNAIADARSLTSAIKGLDESVTG